MIIAFCILDHNIIVIIYSYNVYIFHPISDSVLVFTSFCLKICLKARKALRALKGIVTLQAIIRGRAVRRQAVTTLKRLQSIINIQSQVCANRLQSTEGTFDCDDMNQLNNFRDKLLRVSLNRLGSSLLFYHS